MQHREVVGTRSAGLCKVTLENCGSRPAMFRFLLKNVGTRLQYVLNYACRKWKQCTPGSMNSLFSDLFKEFWRGILGGVRDYLGEIWGGF